MPLNLDQKKAIVAEVAEVASSAYSAIAAQYSGMTVDEMTELRAKARESGVYLRVIKNSLVRRAVADTEFSCMSDALTGQLIMAFSQEDPGCAARVIKDFSKEHSNLVVKAIAIGGELLDASDLDTLATMPTYDQAISILMSVMKAPTEKLARTLNEVPGKLVRTVAAIRDAKEAA